ncbi:phosphatase PAP2 family protein, partial [Staphylococcus aureus]|nr:phosphatase PAP2 family protein [Staphylococcus aureus]
ATSLAIMAILVNSIKYTAKVERPDDSKRNSFPSGHAAMAFTNAAFLDKEYGLVNPAYSIAGYSAATFTGLGRALNNRHWLPDILAG